jgi:hypothetical protein
MSFRSVLRRIRSSLPPAVVVLAVAALVGALPPSGGIQNAGFETGTVGAAPPSWTANGTAITVGAEGPAQFPIYQDKGVTVVPYRGARMARLGIPVTAFKAGASGDNALSQTFSSTSASLLLVTRIFSWEERGRDIVSITITDPSNPTATFPVTDPLSGGAFVLPLPGVAPAQCSATPCSFKIQTRGRRPLLDSGWRELRIAGLPTDGRPLTVRYSSYSEGTAQGTWVYFDEARRPPVARMTINPSGRQLEGDFAFFDCTSSTFDEGGELTCQWDVSGATITPRSLTGPYAIFNFPESDPSLLVTLTVSDGLSSAVTSSDFAASGALEVENAAPIVNALNVEVQQDESVELVCRYVDLGVVDTHLVTLQVGGHTLPITLQSENEQAYASGIARATFDATGLAPGTLSGSCSVRDDEGASQTDAFSVQVLAPAPLRGEPANGSSVTAPILAAGGSYSFDLDRPGDVDIFEVRLADGSALPANSEVELAMSANADYDVVVFSRAPGTTPFESQPLKTSPFLNSPFLNSPFLNSPFLNSPFLNSPFLNSPFLNSPFLNSPFLNSPFLNSPFLNSPFLNSPLVFEDIPLSILAGAPSGSSVSASDIGGIDELGSFDLAGLQAEALVVKAISANLGVTPESALVRVGPEETALYVAVISHEGSFSAAPYQLSVQASRPLDREALLGSNCVGTPRIPAAEATSGVEVLHDVAAPKSIGFIQRQRFQDQHSLDDAAFATWLASIAPALDDPGLAMRLVSVPSTIFDAADVAPCNVAAQNAAAKQVKAVIQDELAHFPSATSVTIFGDQSVIPHHAETDGTDIANERFYGGDALVREDSPLAATLAAGYNLTDAYYTASSGLPFGGRTLWLEQLAIGRLAKHPNDIAAELTSFVLRGGVLDTSRALVTGYDFFADGAAESERVIESLTETRVLNSSTWTAEDLRCEAFGTPPPGGDRVCEVPSLAATNLHGTHFAGLSANGFNAGDFADFVDTTDLYGRLESTLTTSIGCHTGLDVPEAWSIPQAFGLGVDPAFDWAQQAGVQIRPLNYGLGHTEFANRGTEGLLTEVWRRVVQGVPFGEALAATKASYLLNLREVDVYDEDSVISLALIGLPQWRLTPGATPPPPAGGSGGPTPTPFGTLQLALIEAGSSSDTIALPIGRVTTPKGEYFTLDGDADAPQGRAIQATTRLFNGRTVVGTHVHDVALRGGEYTVLTGLDPVIATFTQEWLTSQPEPKACIDTMSPTQLGSVNTLSVAGQTRQTLLFAGSQFECTLAAADRGVLDVTGDARVWTQATIEALHPTSASFDADFVPPQITRQDVVANPATGDIELTLDATDPSGLREIIALVFEDLDAVPGGPGQALAFSTGNLTGASGPFSLTLPGAYGKLISIQYIDGAGNLLLKSFKGKLFEAVPVQIQTSIFSGSASTSVVVEIGFFAGLVSPTLSIDFGDGTSTTLALTDAQGNPTSIVQLLPNGSALVTVTHDYSGFAGNQLTVSVQMNAQGAGGSDSAVLYNCGDPVGDFADPSGDIVSCAVRQAGGLLEADLRVVGEQDSARFAYTMRFPALESEVSLAGDQVSPAGATAQLLPDGVRFSLPPALIGWDGVSPLEVEARTSSAGSGAPADQAGPFSTRP